MLQSTGFDRISFFEKPGFAFIGEGECGGKAQGLIRIMDVINRLSRENSFLNVELGIPSSVVLRSQFFDRLIKLNHLEELAESDEPDDRIAHRFMQAELPPEFLGDLYILAERTTQPVAVRSSSLLEDALQHPLAGLYVTKMIPNHQPDSAVRFQRLCDAIKLVLASIFFRGARDYIRHAGWGVQSDKMAVLIQQVVGTHFYQRFYPHISGVARSYNPYSMGLNHGCGGIVNLALGLGKTIVDGDKCWMYGMTSPSSPPPFNSVREMLDKSQQEFWAVHLGVPPPYNPLHEAEFLVKTGLKEAEYDGSLALCASTYDMQSDRLEYGISMHGPRMLNFASLLVLKQYPLNETIQKVISACQESLQNEVEIEFAVCLKPHSAKPFQFSLLQVRPMAVSSIQCQIDPEEWNHPELLIRSDHLLGNGELNSITDLVYVKPESFRVSETTEMAIDIATINRDLLRNHRAYILVGFGRWGSVDPFLGIPVKWEQIAAAKVIIEAALPEFCPDLSQGSHFFHNLIGLGILYFQTPSWGESKIVWDRLHEQESIHETHYIRHIRSVRPFRVKADSRHQRGVIYR